MKSTALTWIAATVMICMTSVVLPGEPANPPVLPEGNAAQRSSRTEDLVRLGQKLFEDKRLSASGNVSCGTCHVASLAFTDGRTRAKGLNGQVGTRNTPSLLNIIYEKELFWDGRLTGLEEQVRSPLFNPREQGLSDDQQVERILQGLPEYATEFKKAFGTGGVLSTDQLVTAIAAYERTLLTADSPFDRYWFGHELNAISPGAQRGLDLFRGRAACASCHLIGKTSASFTDQEFHPSPVQMDATVTTELSSLTQRVLALHAGGEIRSLSNLISSDTRVAALGRFLSTMNPADIGKFRTPSLRNVAITAPYMHDGSAATLYVAIELELYSRSSALARPVVLTADERADLVEFLATLTTKGLREVQ
jgi:cytochrome c peroxidase